MRRQATARLTKVASEGGSSAAVRGVDEKAALLLPSTDGRLRDCGGVGCLGRGCRAFGSASPERETLHMLAVVALYYTHMGVMPGADSSLSVLLRRFLWHSGMREVRRPWVALSNTLTKQTRTLFVSSTRAHTPVAKRFLFISTSQALPSSQRLVSICARDWRLLQLDRYLASMIRPAMTLLVSRAKLSAPTPARGLPTPPRP